MPNWCSNRLTIKGHERFLKRFVEKAKYADKKDGHTSPFSFRSFLPTPPELQKTRSPNTPYDIKYTDRWKRFADYKWVIENNGGTKPKSREQVIRAIKSHHGYKAGAFDKEADQGRSNVEKHGHVSWYEWNVENWGTKWDCCEVQAAAWEDGDDEWILHFETAWSPPITFLETVSQQYGQLEFHLEYYDEGIMFIGTLVMQNGEQTEAREGQYGDWKDFDFHPPWAGEDEV
jgi:hypothetical protein